MLADIGLYPSHFFASVLVAPRKVVLLDHIRSVWLGLGYIHTPVTGDRINTAGNLWIKSAGGMVSQSKFGLSLWE